MLPENAVEELTRATGQNPSALLRNFDAQWADRRQRKRAIRMADHFYETYADALRPHLGVLQREELVKLVSHYRAHQQDDERIIVDLWLMGRYPPPTVKALHILENS